MWIIPAIVTGNPTPKRTALENNRLPVISSADNMKYLPMNLSEANIVDILSDLKHRVFPRPFERLAIPRDSKNLVGVEIGVAGGEHALSLLRTLDIQKLYLIDPYDLYADYSEGKSHYGIDQLPLSQTETKARQNLFEFKDKIQWIRKLSSDGVRDITEKLDFVYIDGNHDAKYVLQDIEYYLPLLKKFGIIGGHDYYNGYQTEHDDVVRIVTSYASEAKIQLRIELPDWWFQYEG